jgi:hypothetical protein
MALDLTKPYGEITGDTQGRRYVQDDIYYDSMGTALSEAPAPAPAKKAKAAAEVDQVEAQLVI